MCSSNKTVVVYHSPVPLFIQPGSIFSTINKKFPYCQNLIRKLACETGWRLSKLLFRGVGQWCMLSFCNHTEGPLDQQACVTIVVFHTVHVTTWIQGAYVTTWISNRTFREHVSLRTWIRNTTFREHASLRESAIELSGSTCYLRKLSEQQV